MTLPQEPPRQARAHELMLELRQLQSRLNTTIDALCRLAAGDEFAAPPQGRPVAVFVPEVLMLPLPQPVLAVPGTGLELDAHTRLYTDNRSGTLQLMQQPQVGPGGCRYGLAVNFAEGDGSWLSMVFDADALRPADGTGWARLDLRAVTGGRPGYPLHVKCTWRDGADALQSRQGVLPDGAAPQLALDLGGVDLSVCRQFQLHVIFPLGPRGWVELRELSAQLSLQPYDPVRAPDAAGDDVFEAVR